MYVFRIKTSHLVGYDKYDDSINMFLGLNDLKKRNPNEKVLIEFKNEDSSEKKKSSNYRERLRKKPDS